MPKTNYYSFGLSASRDAYNKVYTPGGHSSPRGRDMKDQPGPGEYKYDNMNVGVDARKFSFLKRTKNVQGKSWWCTKQFYCYFYSKNIASGPQEESKAIRTKL